MLSDDSAEWVCVGVAKNLYNINRCVGCDTRRAMALSTDKTLRNFVFTRHKQC